MSGNSMARGRALALLSLVLAACGDSSPPGDDAGGGNGNGGGAQSRTVDADFHTLPTLEPLHSALPGFDVDVPLRVNVPEDFGPEGRGLGVCSQVLPVTRTPRMVAGMPFVDDIIRCQLKPIDPADYGDALNATQLDELRTIFPEGVCDFSKPAAEDVARSLIWPSLGGTTLQEPFELKWRVARSQ